MFREMDKDGQMNIDVRLEPERELQENVNVLLEFAHEQVMRAAEDTVKNRFEGYGLLAEKILSLQAAVKQIGNDMQTLQKTLPIDDVRALDAVSAIDNTLADVVLAATDMSAIAKKVADDLYASRPATPLEEYAAENSDGFEEAEEAKDGSRELPESSDKNLIDISKIPAIPAKSKKKKG